MLSNNKRIKKSLISLESPRYTTDEGDSSITWEQSIDLVPIEERRHRDVRLHEKLYLEDFVNSWKKNYEDFVEEFKSLLQTEFEAINPEYKINLRNQIDFWVSKLYMELSILFSDIKYKVNPNWVINKKRDILAVLKDISFSVDSEPDNLLLKKKFVEILYSLSKKYYFLQAIINEISDALSYLSMKIKKEASFIIKYFLDNYNTILSAIKSDYVNYNYWQYVDNGLSKISTIYNQYLNNDISFEELTSNLKHSIKNASVDNIIFSRLFDISLHKHFIYIDLFKI